MSEKEIIKLWENYVKDKETRVFPGDIQRLLLYIQDGVNYWTLVGKSQIPLIDYVPLIKYLESENIIYIEDGKVHLSNYGKELVKSIMKGKKFRNFVCSHCKGRRVLPYDEIRNEFEKIIKNRPKPKHEFDQGYVSVDTVLSRISYMYSYGDIQSKDVAIFGDDDLVSIALALTELPDRISVFEIDKDLNNFIRNFAREYGYDIEIFDFDLRQPLPEDFINKFDVFQTDPTESLLGFKLFIGRAIASVKQGGSGYFGITKVESSRFKWLEMQKTVLDLGAVITDLIPEFSLYENWDYHEETKGYSIAEVKSEPENHWYRSWFYRVEITKKEKWNGIVENVEEMYDDKESVTV